VKICNSFFKRSAFNGPTPLRYSIGLSNIDGDGILITFTAKIMGIEDYHKELAGRFSLK